MGNSQNETREQRDSRRRAEASQARRQRRNSSDPVERDLQQRQDDDWGTAALRSRTGGL